MTTKLSEMIRQLSPDRRARVEKRAKELVAEEMALRELRSAARLTQKSVGEALGIGQEGVSRIEKRCDLLVSTLRGYVAAMGGRLRLVAELPDRPPVEVIGLSELGAGKEPSEPARRGKGLPKHRRPHGSRRRGTR